MSFRWLKRLADWLDNRFPAKVHVTDEVFQALLKRETERTLRLNTQESEIVALTGLAARQGASLAALRDAVDALLPAVERVEGIEKTIGAIKEVVTKAAAPAAEAARRREEFIASGRFKE